MINHPEPPLSLPFELGGLYAPLSFSYFQSQGRPPLWTPHARVHSRHRRARALRLAPVVAVVKSSLNNNVFGWWSRHILGFCLQTCDESRTNPLQARKGRPPSSWPPHARVHSRHHRARALRLVVLPQVRHTIQRPAAPWGSLLASTISSSPPSPRRTLRALYL